MSKNYGVELQQLGLSAAEARVYLKLIQNGARAATGIAGATGIARTSVYQTLCSLAEKGLVQAGAGYGSRFSAISPDEALRRLVMRNRDALLQESLEKERLADEIAKHLSPLTNDPEPAPQELIQVLRNPHVIAERFDRLQLEAERTVDIITKAPLLNPREGNPTQQKVQQRGIHYRSIYERAVLDDPEVKRYLHTWIANGEDARVYDGQAPLKLVIFDSEIVLMPLTLPDNQVRALVMRHEQLARGLSMLFQSLWDQSQPVETASTDSSIPPTSARPSPNEATP